MPVKITDLGRRLTIRDVQRRRAERTVWVVASAEGQQTVTSNKFTWSSP